MLPMTIRLVHAPRARTLRKRHGYYVRFWAWSSSGRAIYSWAKS